MHPNKAKGAGKSRINPERRGPLGKENERKREKAEEVGGSRMKKRALPCRKVSVGKNDRNVGKTLLGKNFESRKLSQRSSRSKKSEEESSVSQTMGSAMEGD